MSVDVAAMLDLLVSGGDNRIALDPVTGRNIYGYGAIPSPGDLSFSSSTASTISPRGYEAARVAYERIARKRSRSDPAELYASETETVRSRLRRAFGLGAADIILAASGTDLHLIAAVLLRNLHQKPVLTLSLTGSETGSGVGLAASGRHPMPHTITGRQVVKGSPLGDLNITAQAFQARENDGLLRAEAELADELAAAIEQAINSGNHCLLIATDVSKTGLIAPAPATVLALKARFADHLDILVDGCQLRLAPDTIRAYLQRNWLIAVTGSKFVAGPIFSGALIVPDDLAKDLRYTPIEDALGDYSCQGDWPSDWRAAEALPKRANFGLLLRWQAALAELEAMLSHHPLRLGWVMLRFADAIETRLKADPRFEPVAGRRLDRSDLGLDVNYDLNPTIFPFLLRRGAQVLDAAEMTAVYQRLALGNPGSSLVRLGQPVALGTRDGVSLAALRLCLSAPLVTEAATSDGALDRLISDGLSALDEVAAFAGKRIEKRA